ncbi:hypothetical protein Q1695_002111 [Nippostrongylus brasiliensis]|nr:hypothetical protein Q1695_002111 [Nippostrongylus brasiliensis]
MNDRIRQQALGAHNYRRSLLALNQVRKNTGRLLPGATNMRKYTYDCTLENNARLVAETCVSTPNTAGVVENVHQLPKSSAADRVTAMRLAIIQWWKQVRRVPGFGMKAIYRPKHQGTAIEPFIKMAWADTPGVGCAVSARPLCGNSWTVVCHYSANTFVTNSKIYLPGNACAACPTGTACVQAEGLCA